MSNNELNIDETLVSIMNKRHRTAAKSFKSPPQPRFCIREKSLEDGRDVFINVLSYSRIANQLSEFDPVPLYGGMQIKSYNSIKNSFQQQQALSGIGEDFTPIAPAAAAPSTQLIFAVMASPEVLKKTGRNVPDTPEQMNLVELMCEFCEAMNPGLKLSKKPQILKDRDLTGELKDIWTAVQNFREKEKSGISDIVVYTEFGPDSCAAPVTPIVREFDSSIDACMMMKNETINNSLKKESFRPQEEFTEQQKDADAEKSTSNDDETKASSIENDNIELDKLSIGDKKSKSSNSSVSENESSEKIVKVHNQKNKESQHHFFPKFLTSSKEKDTKEKEKDKEKSDEHETKVKTKKTLNFFRRNKSSATASPTHNSNSNNVGSE